MECELYASPCSNDPDPLEIASATFLLTSTAPKWRITTRQSFRRYHDVWLNAPVLDGEIASGTPHSGHHFIGDEQNIVAATYLSHLLEITVRRDCCAQGRTTYRL